MAGVLTSAFSNLHRCCQCCQCCHCCQFHRWLSRLRWGVRRSKITATAPTGYLATRFWSRGNSIYVPPRAQERAGQWNKHNTYQNDMELIIQWKTKPNFKSIPDRPALVCSKPHHTMQPWRHHYLALREGGSFNWAHLSHQSQASTPHV